MSLRAQTVPPAPRTQAVVGIPAPPVAGPSAPGTPAIAVAGTPAPPVAPPSAPGTHAVAGTPVPPVAPPSAPGTQAVAGTPTTAGPQEFDDARRFLQATFPQAYGGMEGSVTSITSFIVLEVGHNAVFEATAVAALPNQQVTFQVVRVPYVKLLELSSRIGDDLPTIEAAGMAVFGFGPDPIAGDVSVGLERADASAVGAAQAFFDQRYGTGLTHVVSLSKGIIPSPTQPRRRTLSTLGAPLGRPT